MPFPIRTQEWLKSRLVELEHILQDMGANFSGIAASAVELRDRFEEGRFRLAVVGQFKRGKSTLLNALLHEPLLPSGVVPLTAVPTMLHYGFERHVRIVFRDGRSEDHRGSLEHLQEVLTRYVAEQGNPGNMSLVARVEVAHPASLLAKSVEIIDTPGIGSTVLSNTRTARDTLPICDGALFVLSPDPPITEVEVEFLKAVHTAAARVIVVLTKADLLGRSERDELLAFLEKVLHDEAGLSEDVRILVVSARRALEAYPQRDEVSLVQSGIPELEAFLAEFFLTEKHAALQEAIQRKGSHLAREACFLLDLQRKAIELPREDLDRRIERFERHLAQLQKAQGYFHDQLKGDYQRIMEEIDQQGVLLCSQAQAALTAVVHGVCESKRHTSALGQLESDVRRALSEEVVRIFERANTDFSATVADRFRSIQEHHCREMEVLIHRIRQTAAELFEVPCFDGVILDRVDALRESNIAGYRWVTSFTESATSLLSRLLPWRVRAKWIEQRLQDDIGYLVVRNIGELRWTTSQNLDEAFRRFETRTDTQLTGIVCSIRASIQKAVEMQGGREAREGPELSRLRHHRERLEHLWTMLSAAKTSKLEQGLL
jgi:GTP-binding protein EngB required for normal cell division